MKTVVVSNASPSGSLFSDRIVNKPLIDFYRCPENVINFIIASELSSEPGYFRFGRDIVCYGQSCFGSPSRFPCNDLFDLSECVTWDGANIRIPFDVSQFIDNLRCERYTGMRNIFQNGYVQRIYYLVRPMLGLKIRKYFQKFVFRNRRELHFPKWPVDVTVERMLERLLFLSMKAQGIKEVPFIWFWPEGTSSCAIITHDVETKAGYKFAPRLMEVDDAFGIKASFQIIPNGPYPLSNDILEGIRSRGFELNIQDLSHDGNLFDDHERFLTRAKSINNYIHKYGAQGFRAGRMYRNNEWFEALDVSYDMSMPNVAHLEPQRGGCCTVFPYFIGRILELPLTTAQDYSVLHILNDYSLALWKKQIRLIMKRHGLVSFIIHPDYCMEDAALELYKSLLSYLLILRDKVKLWIALPKDVDHWWRARSQMKLVQRRGTWQIEGAGKERARIAYATVCGDTIRYTFDHAAKDT